MVRSIYQNQYESLLSKAQAELLSELTDTTSLSQAMLTIEKKYSIFAISIPSVQSEDNFNATLRGELEKKHLPYNRLWIVEERMQAVAKGSTSLMSFRQDNIKQSYKALLFPVEGQTVILITSVVDGSEWLELHNRYMPLVFLLGFVLLSFFLWKTSQRISQPLKALTHMAQQISNNHYEQVSLQTGDEFEMLAEQLNSMSVTLQNYYEMITNQNDWLKNTLQNMSHEIKTPLAVLFAQITAYRDGILTDVNYETLIDSVDRLNTLIEQMLVLASLQQSVYKQESVSLSDLIHTQVAHLYLLFEQRELSLTLDIEPNCVILGDEMKLRLVIDNLLTNALKYATQGNVGIRLFRETTSQHIRLIISNESIPITDEDLQQLEQPFFTSEKSRHRSLSGTGLGLSQVATILDRHGFKHSIGYHAGIFEYEAWF